MPRMVVLSPALGKLTLTGTCEGGCGPPAAPRCGQLMRCDMLGTSGSAQPLPLLRPSCVCGPSENTWSQFPAPGKKKKGEAFEASLGKQSRWLGCFLFPGKEEKAVHGTAQGHLE